MTSFKSLTKYNLLTLSIMIGIFSFLVINVMFNLTHNWFLLSGIYIIYLERYFCLKNSINYKDYYRQHLISEIADADKIYWNSKLKRTLNWFFPGCSQIYFTGVDLTIHTVHTRFEYPEFENYVNDHHTLFLRYMQLKETGFILLNGIALVEMLIYFIFSFDLVLAYKNISFNREINNPDLCIYNRSVCGWIEFVFDWKNLTKLKTEKRGLKIAKKLEKKIEDRIKNWKEPIVEKNMLNS